MPVLSLGVADGEAREVLRLDVFLLDPPGAAAWVGRAGAKEVAVDLHQNVIGLGVDRHALAATVTGAPPLGELGGDARVDAEHLRDRARAVQRNRLVDRRLAPVPAAP